MARRIAVWVFGVLASGIFGGLIGEKLDYDGGFWGFLGGTFAFACVRLWLGERVSKGSQDTMNNDFTLETEDDAFEVPTDTRGWVNDEDAHEETQKWFKVKYLCEIAGMSIEGLNHERDEEREYERKRFEKLKQEALDLTDEIEDEFCHGGAIHCLVKLYLRAGKEDEARKLIEQITDDFIKEQALAEFDQERE